MQRYSGDISVESAAGQGATFVVKLPQALGARKSEQPARNGFGLSLAQQKQAPPSPAPAPSAHQIVPRGKGLRILVIEDEESIRRFLSTGLTHLGHSARLAADGAEGLALFAKEPFDVVLTDLGLPGMSGEDVARTIASQSPKTPVILLTGWSHQLREAGKSLVGVTRVLGKPVTLDTLNGALVGVCTT